VSDTTAPGTRGGPRKGRWSTRGPSCPSGIRCSRRRRRSPPARCSKGSTRSAQRRTNLSRGAYQTVLRGRPQSQPVGSDHHPSGPRSRSSGQRPYSEHAIAASKLSGSGSWGATPRIRLPPRRQAGHTVIPKWLPRGWPGRRR
jgi:hypothetical protein